MQSKIRESAKLSLLASCGLLAVVASQPAQAATLNGPITFPSAQSVSGTSICFVQSSFNVTGTQDDNGSGSDQIYIQSFSGTGGNGAGSNIFFANGSTVTLNRNIQFIAGFNVREPHYAKLYDLIGPAGPGQGIVQLSQSQIPRSVLLAAGGNCAAIAENVDPTNNAGADQSLPTGGGTVTLAGAASDGDGDTMTHSWTQVSGPPVTLSGANTLNPTFTAPPQINQPRSMVFRLTSSDGIGNPVTDDVVVTIAAGPNTLPTANAGADATIAPGVSHPLVGSGNDIDGDSLTYQWSQVSGPSVTITNANSANASFIAPASNGSIQTLTFQLIANDGAGDSPPDTVTFTIPANSPPTVNAGTDQTVQGGTSVQLAGSAVDPEGDTLIYQWTQVAGPSVTLTGANTANASFTAPPGGVGNQTLTFRLTAFDGVNGGDLPEDLVDIVVLPNGPPVANAGPDQGPINTGTTVTLNGGASTDPDGNPLTYTWTQVSGPTVTLTNPTSATPTFVAPNVNGTQNLVFQLVVNDGSVNSQPDTVTIAVRAVGTITIIQRVQGADGTFTYTSDVNALTGSITTANGSGTLVASLVPAGSHTVTAGDARAAGYALTSIACNDGDSVVNLANRNVAIALSPNENLVCTFTSTNTREAALVAIGNFLTARNAALLANRPDLQRRLDRLDGVMPTGGSASIAGLPIPGSGHLPVSLNVMNGRAHATTSLGMLNAAGKGGRPSKPFDIWAEAYFASLDYDRHEGDFRVIYTGADYRITPDLLVGVLAQFDDFDIKGARIAGSADGHGWMVGPYMTAKIAPNLYVDARAAWGKSDNTVSPLGTYVDAFKTNRSLYSGSLIGQFDLSSAAQFRPEVTVRYLEERQQGYLDFYGVTIPSQTVGQGDISFRPRLHYTTSVGNGWALRPYAEAEGIYTFGLERQSVLADNFRMRIEGGADLFSTGGLRLGLSGFHDGIGSGGLKSTGAHLSVSLGF